MQKAEVKYGDRTAGWLIQDEEGYRFLYDQAYLESNDAKPVSLTLPLQSAAYSSRTMFPFFDGLIPEGWLLEVAERNWKLDSRDRMGLLMNCCQDCIGAVSVHPVIME
jgi:serine/threonine-protein kinase HipA